MNNYKEIERSIIKKFRKEIWCRFTRGVREYQLINEGDKIAVCISGGKDSMLMAKCIQELQRHSRIKFEAVFLVMDPGYSEAHRRTLEENAAALNIPLTFFETQIFDIVDQVSGGSPCYLCARMRRGYLYNNAKELGCNKIALGHHYDDVIETILLSMFYSGEIKTMMPKLHSTNFEGMELIRPMYMIREEHILQWKNYNNLQFLNCACHFTKNCDSGESNSKRLEIKNLIKSLRQQSHMIEHNIFRSVENVHVDAIVGYTKNNVNHSFLETYE